MKVNLSGVITIFPVFKPKTKREKEEKKKDKKQTELFKKSNEVKPVDYDRNNSISENGTTLRVAARNKIKNAILHKYYSTGGDYSRKLKFFTYTVQAAQYKELEESYLKELEKIDLLEQQEKDFAPLRPTRFSERDYLKKRRKKLQHPDQYYIQIFSSYLENLQKRKKQNIESYVWVAEKTEQGVIHFHCIFETKFLNAKQESIDWAGRCKFKAEKTTFNTPGSYVMVSGQSKQVKGSHPFSNCVQYGVTRANGTTIQNNKSGQVLDPAEIASYITKYVTKNESKIFGRTYGMSKSFTASARSGSDRFTMPEVLLREHTVQGSKISGKGVLCFKNNKMEFDPDTGEYFGKPIENGKIRDLQNAPDVLLNFNLLSVKEFTCKAGVMPIYIVTASQESIIKYCFPELYKKSKPLFDYQARKAAQRKKEQRQPIRKPDFPKKKSKNLV